MQQTAFDRWLRKKFVYITHIYCNTLPGGMPAEIQVEETNPESGGRYLYRLTVPNEKLLIEVTARLETSNITYTSRVADHNGFIQKMVNNPHKSFTMQIAWVIFIIAIIAIAFSGLPGYLWRTLSV